VPPARVAADFGGLLRTLRAGDVDFIVVGGVAGAAHGLARATYDLLGELTGGGGYEDLLSDSVEAEAYGVTCRFLGLERLIAVKRAAGRPKDLEAIAELEALEEERG
jgi:hypothetical protein